MKKILMCIFLFILSFSLTGCFNKGIDYEVAYDNEGVFGFKQPNGGLKLFDNAYITSKDQLISLCDEWGNKAFNENEEYYNSDLAKLLRTYDDEYFKINNLLIVEFETGKGIYSKVKRISVDENDLVVTIKQKELNGVWTTEAFHWLMIIEVSKENTSSVTNLKVNLE